MSYEELDRVSVIERVIEKRLTQHEAAEARCPSPDVIDAERLRLHPHPGARRSVLASRRGRR